MHGFIRTIDYLSSWVGKAFAWCILVLTFGTTYEVVMRYAFNAPTTWAFDMSYIMYGALFMMAGAYTLSRDAHVRGDVVYRLLPPRAQASIELALYLLFFFPGMAALIWGGYHYAMESWSYMPYGTEGARGEISINSPLGVPVSPLKTLLPIAAAFCFIQGIAEVSRCIVCLRVGGWPERLKDIEETEDQLLAQMREREQDLEHQMRLDEEETLPAGDGDRDGGTPR